MAALLAQVEFWHWWVLAAVLLAIEVFAPTTLFLWTGAAAVVVGIIVLVVPGISWEFQILLFAVLSVVSVVVGRILLRLRASKPGEASTLNRRAE